MIRRLAFFVFLASLTGCALPPRFPIIGVLYTGVQQGVSATAQLSVKRGESCAMHILGLIATGDASIDGARKNGGIRSISTVDEQVTSFLFGLYSQVCTVVHGK